MEEQAKLWGQYRMWVEEQNKPYTEKYRKDFKDFIDQRKKLEKLELSRKERYEKAKKAHDRKIDKFEKLHWWQKIGKKDPNDEYFESYPLTGFHSYMLLWPPIYYSPYKVTQNGFMNWLTDVKFFPIKEAVKMIPKNEI